MTRFFATLKSLGPFTARIVELAFLALSVASWAVSWGRCSPRTALMRRITHEVVQKILPLHERHVVPLRQGAIRLGVGMELEISLTIDEPNALKIIHTRLLWRLAFFN
jgi:cystathionine beta-lyase/cystathionine gamma-synthase